MIARRRERCDASILGAVGIKSHSIDERGSVARSNIMETVTLQSSEGVDVRLSMEAAMTCLTIKNMLEDLPDQGDVPIPLPNMTTKVLKKVVEFCNYHVDHPEVTQEVHRDESRLGEVSSWNKRFCDVDQALLFDLVLASNYLENRSMLDVLSNVIADSIRGLSTLEIRAKFNLRNDFTPEEEEEVRLENAWCEEP